MSSGSAEGTEAIGEAVAGSSVSNVSPETAGSHSPPMSIPWVREMKSREAWERASVVVMAPPKARARSSGPRGGRTPRRPRGHPRAPCGASRGGRGRAPRGRGCPRGLRGVRPPRGPEDRALALGGAMTTTEALSQASRDFISRTHGMLIGGEWLPAVSGETFETLDPATASPIASVPSADPEDIDKAVAAARAAFADDAPWRKMPAPQRALAIHRLADLIEDRKSTRLNSSH